MNTADMLIHVHPELDPQARSNLERRIMGVVGVDCAEFDHHAHPHSIVVKYDPDQVQGIQILDIVRTVDPVATRVGM
ncbi:MAG TPA: hypothetical protein VMV48_10610 [Gallionellaceae bacterium]|nr:hypothetical protein [Gallionellaceae bacterium]